MITITKPELFAAAARFVWTSPVGTATVAGVYIEPGGFITATDGHRMFCGHDPDATIERAAIIRPPKPKMPAAWFKAGELTLDGETARLNGDILTAPEIDGTFPDHRRVTPRKTTGTFPRTLTFNWDYLADFNAVAKHLGCPAPTIALNDDNPTLIGFGTRDDCYGAIMPMRVKTTVATLPEWA